MYTKIQTFREKRANIPLCLLILTKSRYHDGIRSVSTLFVGRVKDKRRRVEREVGGGIGMGNTCKSMADSCQCMTKPTTILYSN